MGLWPRSGLGWGACRVSGQGPLQCLCSPADGGVGTWGHSVPRRLDKRCFRGSGQLRVFCLTMHWALFPTSLHSPDAGHPAGPQPPGWMGPECPPPRAFQISSDNLLWDGTKACQFSRDRLDPLQGGRKEGRKERRKEGRGKKERKKGKKEKEREKRKERKRERKKERERRKERKRERKKERDETKRCSKS